MTADGLVEGNTAAPVAVPANVLTFNTPFLTDIADKAVPRAGFTPDADSVVSPALTPCAQPGVPAGCATQYDDELLDLHFVAGDGRANENIALTSIHQVFHSEHDRMVADIQDTLLGDTTPSGVAALAQWQDPNGAARLERRAPLPGGPVRDRDGVPAPGVRGVRPQDGAGDPGVPGLRRRHQRGHPGRVRPRRLPARPLDARRAGRPHRATANDNSLPLLEAFLNPPEYFTTAARSTASSRRRRPPAAILMGASDQVGNELDEFMTDTLRNNLLGLPLDLATLNLTRARETRACRR